MVAFAVFLPIVVLLASFVLDIGNWFEHRRHLQMQADAAVLAAAGEVTSACSDPDVDAMAQKYAGVKPATEGYNQQVGGTALQDVLYKLNSPTWPDQPEDVDPDPPPGGWDTPCKTGIVDVKLAERDLPWLFKAAKVGFINAHARVAIRKASYVKGQLPIGVPEVNPKKAMAVFVNENTGEVIRKVELCAGASSGGRTMYSNQPGSCRDADKVVAPAAVRVATKNIGVRIVLSGSDSTSCGDPLVECYPAGSQDGLVHVRGWLDGTATATQPIAKDVQLQQGSCPNAYFMDISTDCNLQIVADVDFSVADPDTALGATVDATVGNTTYALAYVDGRWRSDAVIPVPAAGGTVEVGLQWRTTEVTKKECGAREDGCAFPKVQRAFSAAAATSGPIREAAVFENGLPIAGSFQRCTSDTDQACEHQLVVGIAIDAALSDVPAGPGDPPVALRLGDGNQTQALDCDPDIPNLKDELAQGCGTKYRINEGEMCPDPGSIATLKSTFDEPWPCVAVKTGEPPNQIPEGLNLRILGSEKPDTCTNPNLWDEYLAGDHELAGDPRLVQVFLTPFGSFSDTGNKTVPVTRFAAFYITGWTGQGNGFKNPCAAPDGGDDPVPDDGGGYMVGHFVTYVTPVNEGQAGDEQCDFESLEICVPVLTK